MELYWAVKLLEGLDPSSDDFKSAMVDLLNHIDPNKPYGTALFNAIARISVTEALEAVLLREEDGRLLVYMTERSLDDTAYPGQCHVPGSIFRVGEYEANVITRLEKEFGCHIKTRSLIDDFRFQEARGWFHSFIYLVDTESEPQNKRGAWYPVDCLPENVVDHHRDHIIPTAVMAYRLKK